VAIGLCALLSFPSPREGAPSPDYIIRLPSILFVCGFLAGVFTQRIITRRPLAMVVCSVLLTFVLNSLFLVGTFSSSIKGMAYFPLFFMANVTGAGYLYQSTLPALICLWVFIHFANWIFDKIQFKPVSSQ
jgi:hypothetical protein